MNICLFSDSYLPEINGVATSVNSLYKLLKSYGHNVRVVTTTDQKDVVIEGDVIRIPGITLKKIYGYKLSNIYNSKAFKYLKTLHLDVIHINSEFGIGQFGFIVASILNCATVYTYHTMYEEYTYYITKGYFDRFSKWVIREYAKDCMERATEIISPSEKTKNYIRLIGINKYVNVVPTGFNFSRFQDVDHLDPKVLEIKRKYNISEDDRVLICLGRIAKEKSFDVVIKGYKKYLDTYKNKKTKLLFVGAGPALDELKDLSSKLNLNDNIIFVGKVNQDETQYYYRTAEVFLNASTSETQGLTFMEAMASNLLVLCRFDNSLLGVINNNVNGFFYIDEDDFKDKLNSVLNLDKEKVEKIKSNALSSIDKFSDKTFYSNIIEVYNRARRRSW